VTVRDGFPIVHTPHVSRAAAFYCDLLGFEAGYRLPEQGEPEFLTISLGPFSIGLVKQDEPEPPGRVVFWFYADDVDAEVANLRDAGVTVVSEPADMEWGERMAIVADPDGNPIHLGQKL
jgi:lactoylglutathione lyase